MDENIIYKKNIGKFVFLIKNNIKYIAFKKNQIIKVIKI